MSLISAFTHWRTLALLVVFTSVFCLILVACNASPSNNNADSRKLSADTQATLMTALQANLANRDGNERKCAVRMFLHVWGINQTNADEQTWLELHGWEECPAEEINLTGKMLRA